MPEPECSYCGREITERSDPVVVETVTDATFTKHDGAVDIGSYEQDSIEFYHRNCWKHISDIIAEAATEVGSPSG